MAKKTEKKTVKKAKKKTEGCDVAAYKPSKEVNVEKIKNGYVVSKYTQDGQVKEHVKNKAGVGRVVNKMIGG